VGATLSPGYYLFDAVPRPHRTPTGVERRLFGLEDLDPKLLESPSGGQWLLVQKAADPYTAVGPSISFPLTLWQRLRSFRWPDDEKAPHTLSLSTDPGTWQIEGSSVRKICSRTATGWLGDEHLWAWDGDGPAPAWVFDLRRGRTVQGKAAGEADGYYQQVEDRYYEQKRDEWDHADDPNSPERLLRSTLSSALEELPADLSQGWEYVHAASGAMGVYLVFTKGPDDDPVALYAISDDPVPRIVRLTRNARPLALSRDGRTLFFERNRALWRLDLRQPLPALLAEVSLPELPDPLIDR
jgi:hypothetical protein